MSKKNKKQSTLQTSAAVKKETVEKKAVETQKETPKKEAPKTETPKKETHKTEAPKKEKPQKVTIKNDTPKKKVTVKDWIIIVVSIIAVLLLIFIVYSTNRYDRAVSEMLISDSKKENFTVAVTVNAIELIQINEVSAEKWVELYNSGTEDADISGSQIYVSDKSVATIADGTVIPSGGYIAVDITANPGADDENVVSLVGSDGKKINTILVPKLTGTQSYGLTNNESFNSGYMAATKGTVNKLEISAEDYTYYDGIGFSTPGGFYDKAFSLSLSAKNGDKIYYTTDGSEPTTESTLYTEGFTISSKSGTKYTYARLGFGYLGKESYSPYTIDAGMVVRAITVNSAGKVTGSATQEYYIGLANDSSYTDIPVLSLTANPDDLFGYFDGIYVAGRSKEDAAIKGEGSAANYLNGWSRKGSLSFYEAEKDKSFEKEVSVKMYSDSEISTRQKSFEFTFSDASGFEGSTIRKYITQDGKLIFQGFLGDTDLRIKDIFINNLMKDSKVGTLECSPCILFINGEYWGVYLLKAPYDSNYIERNYGISDKVIIRTHKAYQREFNDMYNFVTRNDMSDSANYAQVKKMMDVDNYLEYVCLNVYIGNSSFRSTHGTQWRTVSSGGSGYADGRWRWFMNTPIGNTMGSSSMQTTTIDTFLQKALRTDRFFQSLLMNKEFCKSLVSTMERISNETFAQEKLEKAIDDAAAYMKKPTTETYKRYFGTMKDSTYLSQVDSIKAYFNGRTEYMMIYAKELAENGGDLAYIDELEAQGISTEADETETEEESEETENVGDAEDTNKEGEGTEEFMNDEVIIAPNDTIGQDIENNNG